jgi:uncharacterized membrane protein
MAIGMALLITLILVVAVWVIIEIKRMKHKIFAIVLIIAILFVYLSVVYVFKGHDIDLGSISGMVDASKLYLSWLGGVFGNMKSITTNAIKLDWGLNKSITT